MAIAPAGGFHDSQLVVEREAWLARHESTEGWAKYNRNYWLEGGYDDFVQWFFATAFPEPHSTKQIENGVRWAHVSPS